MLKAFALARRHGRRHLAIDSTTFLWARHRGCVWLTLILSETCRSCTSVPKLESRAACLVSRRPVWASRFQLECRAVVAESRVTRAYLIMRQFDRTVLNPFPGRYTFFFFFFALNKKVCVTPWNGSTC